MNGVEAWCNLEGKYVSFVREATAQPPLDEIILCTLGIISDPLATLPSQAECITTSIQKDVIENVSIEPNGEETLVTFDPWTALCNGIKWEYEAFY